MSGFSIDWLDLREDADRRARDADLRQQALDWLESGQSPDPAPVVVDLGAGTGSTLRALSTDSPAALRWRLVDHDSALLSEAQRRHGSTHSIETCTADLSQLDTLPLVDARLVTASALFDLVSADFIQALANLLQRQSQHSPVGLYSALNYDGSTQWTPAHPLDGDVLAAFNQDQRTDKGFGPALGPDSGTEMHKAFTQAGFEVVTADSPWVLDGDDEAMVSALIDGIASAVASHNGLDKTALQDWVRFRQAHLASGTCTVGHVDVLATKASH